MSRQFNCEPSSPLKTFTTVTHTSYRKKSKSNYLVQAVIGIIYCGIYFCQSFLLLPTISIFHPRLHHSIDDNIPPRGLTTLNMNDRQRHFITQRVVPSTLIAPLFVKQQRKIPAIPTPAFLITSLFLPVWSVTFLPVTLLYQTGKRILSSLIGGNRQIFAPLDSGYVVNTKESQIVPRSERKYDIVILGATGFTGRLALRHLLDKYYDKDDGASNLLKRRVRWAIAGRDEKKLCKILVDTAKELNLNSDEVLKTIDRIIVDTSIPATMPKLVEQARCIATTVGPYTLYGNSVVEFCVKFGTHYVDITGEIDWVRLMIHQWQNTASQTGSILVPFCGHDSIPWDLSVSKLRDLLQQNCNDTLQSVTFWDAAIGGAPGGTLATAYMLIEGNGPKIPKFDVDPFIQIFKPITTEAANDPSHPSTKTQSKCVSNNPSMLEKSTSPWESSIDNPKAAKRWTLPYIMAGVNYEVVRWSHALLEKVHQDVGVHVKQGLSASSPSTLYYKEVNLVPNFQSAFTIYSGLLMFGSMLLNPITAYFMKRYVLPKSGEGPLMKDMQNNSYLCIYGEGIGSNKENVVESIYYISKDAGCLETSKMLIEAGLCLALEEDKLPIREGGFYSPSVALGNDILMNRLLKQTCLEYVSRVVPKQELK